MTINSTNSFIGNGMKAADSLTHSEHTYEGLDLKQSSEVSIFML